MSKDIILDIKIPNIKDIEKKLRGMEKEAPKVLRNAVNKTLRETSKLMVKSVKANYVVRNAPANKTIEIDKAKGKKFSGKVVSKSTKRIELFGFSVSSKKPQPLNPSDIRAKLKKKGARKALPGNADRSAAFVAQMKSGHTGVFQRVLGYSVKNSTERTDRRAHSKWAGSPDYRIAELYGLPIPYMMGEEEAAKGIKKEAEEFLKKQIDEEISKIIRKGKK